MVELGLGYKYRAVMLGFGLELDNGGTVARTRVLVAFSLNPTVTLNRNVDSPAQQLRTGAPALMFRRAVFFPSAPSLASCKHNEGSGECTTKAHIMAHAK